MGRSRLLMGLAVLVIAGGVLIAFLAGNEGCDGLAVIADSEEHAVLAERLSGAEPWTENTEIDGITYIIYGFDLHPGPDGTMGHALFLVNREDCSLTMVHAFEYRDDCDEYYLVRDLLSGSEFHMSKDDYQIQMGSWASLDER